MPTYDLHLSKSRVITVIPTLDGVPTTNAENCEFDTTAAGITLGPDPDFPEDSFKVAVKLTAAETAEVTYKFDGHKGDGVVEVTGSFTINPLEDDANGATTEAGPEFSA